MVRSLCLRERQEIEDKAAVETGVRCFRPLMLNFFCCRCDWPSDGTNGCPVKISADNSSHVKKFSRLNDDVYLSLIHI